MPEGDTIHRTVNRLRPALVGKELCRFEAPRARGRRPAAGTTIEAVDAVGKHVVVRFADGTLLRTHLRMSGSWHLYRPGERWQRPPGTARALIEVDGWMAVCFAAPVVSLERAPTGSEAGNPASLAHLGPDLTRADIGDAGLDAAAGRLARAGAQEIKTALLDQRIAAGIGNVFASEVLWLCGVSPFARVGDLAPEVHRGLLATAARLLAQNTAGSGPRQTYRGGLAVYGRAGRPCPRCGTRVRTARQGEHARSTWWCPGCQPLGGERPT